MPNDLNVNSSFLTIMCLLSESADKSVLINLAQRSQWSILLAENISHALEICQRSDPQIIFLDRDFPDQDWRKSIASLAASSSACIILASKVLDDHLWSDVVCNGGYEILPKPLREDEVSRTVNLARTYWKSANKYTLNSRK